MVAREPDRVRVYFRIFVFRKGFCEFYGNFYLLGGKKTKVEVFRPAVVGGSSPTANLCADVGQEARGLDEIGFTKVRRKKKKENRVLFW